MAICEITDLGAFDHCNEIVIGVVTDSVSILNTVTRRQCTYADGSSIGYLSPGDYLFTFESITYEFKVT